MYGSAQQGFQDPSMGYQAGNQQAGYAPQPMGGMPMGAPLMGGPPMGMGAMGQPAMAAQAEVAKLEEKKKNKEEKDKEKEQKREADMMRSCNRRQGENRFFSTVLIGWGIANGLMWGLPLMGDSWWTKVWTGMSIDQLEMTVGLFNMEVQLKCEDKLDNKLCNAMMPYATHNDGKWTMHEIEEKMCRESKESCFTMRRFSKAGYCPLCFLPVAAIFEVVSIVLLYKYWNGSANSTTRQSYQKMAALAPLFGIIGLVGWMVISPYTQEMPRLWAKAAGLGDFANSSLFGLSETFIVPMGWCTIALFSAVGSSCVRSIMQYFMERSMDEPLETDCLSPDEQTKFAEAPDKMYDNSQMA